MIILSHLVLALFLIHLRFVFFLLIHNHLIVIDRLVVLHLIISTQIVFHLLFGLFGVDVVVLVYFMQVIGFVLRVATLHITLILILIVVMCVAVVLLLVRILLISQSDDLLLAILHVLVMAGHASRLIVDVFVVHLTQVLLWS